MKLRQDFVMTIRLRFMNTPGNWVSVIRTPSCKRVGPIALLRYDQALKEGVEEVAKTDSRTCA
jgi:hypothetical protein